MNSTILNISIHKRLQKENILLQLYLNLIDIIYCKDKRPLAKGDLHLPEHKAPMLQWAKGSKDSQLILALKGT